MRSLQDKYDALAAQCREAESRREQAETALAAAEQGSSSATTRLEGELQRNAQLLVMAQNDVAELRTTKLELETELVRSTPCKTSHVTAAPQNRLMILNKGE